MTRDEDVRSAKVFAADASESSDELQGDRQTLVGIVDSVLLPCRVRVQSRRQYPELVTREPAPDDEEVYGAPWPLVEEWQRLREGHPNDGRSLSWLVTEERILNLELAMAEEHGLTLPPETSRSRGCGGTGSDAR